MSEEIVQDNFAEEVVDGTGLGPQQSKPITTAEAADVE